MELTPQQKRKLEKIADIADQGIVALAKYLFELEEKLDAEIPSVKNLMERIKGDKGDNYVFTKKEREKILNQIFSMFDFNEIASLVKIDEKSIAKKASKLIKIDVPPPIKPSKQELLDLILPLIPEPIPGDPGKDADEQSIISQISNNLPILGDRIRDALELLKGEEKLRMEAILGLVEKFQEIEKKIEDVKTAVLSRGGVSTGGLYNTVRVEDLSPQCDGVKKIFEVPRHRRVVGLRSTQFPIIYRYGIDFVTSNKQLTLTDEVSAVEEGQTLIFEYIK